MKLNLDTLKTEIDDYLKKSGFVVFYGFSRGLDDVPEVDWDTVHHPDYKMFLEVAKQLGTKLVVLHHRQFNSAILDRALEELATAGFEFDDQRQLESRLRELSMYDGFTCAIELSFDYSGTMYAFELRTEWYNEVNEILDQLELGGDDDDKDDGEGGFGGYYSKN
jgi:hypothetical protein